MDDTTEMIVLLRGEVQRLQNLYEAHAKSLRDLTETQEQLPIVIELRNQITELRGQLIEQDRFTKQFQQLVIKQLIDLLTESKVITGPSYRRLKPTLDNLEHLIATPEVYVTNRPKP